MPENCRLDCLCYSPRDVLVSHLSPPPPLSPVLTTGSACFLPRCPRFLRARLFCLPSLDPAFATRTRLRFLP